MMSRTLTIGFCLIPVFIQSNQTKPGSREGIVKVVIFALDTICMKQNLVIRKIHDSKL